MQQPDATTPVVATLLPRPLLRVQHELVLHLEEEPTKLVDSHEVPSLHRGSRGERVLDDPTDRARVVRVHERRRDVSPEGHVTVARRGVWRARVHRVDACGTRVVLKREAAGRFRTSWSRPVQTSRIARAPGTHESCRSASPMPSRRTPAQRPRTSGRPRLNDSPRRPELPPKNSRRQNLPALRSSTRFTRQSPLRALRARASVPY